MILINSYLFTAEYPRQGKISRKPAFKKETPKSLSIMLHNQSNYDISTESLVIIPGESKKIQLPENLELTVFVNALDNALTLKFKNPLPQNVCFTEKSDLVELTYDKDCIKKYICK